jgi:alcohol dehydrogenase class IV
VTNPTPIARENILYASYLAGKAINISKTTAPHAISYSLTNEYGIPHGHAVALTLGSFMDYNFNSSPELYLGKGEFEIYKKHFRELLNVLKVNDTNEAKMKLTSMMIRGEMAINLRGIGMENEDEIDFICDSVNAERLKNNPFEVSRYNLYNLLRNIY